MTKKRKRTHFEQGQQYGHLAIVIPEAKYRVVIADPTWTYVAPANPGAYVAAALMPWVSAAQRNSIVAQHKIEEPDYADYLGVKKRARNSFCMEWVTTLSPH